MATLYLSLSSKKRPDGDHEVLARFTVGSRVNQRAKTNIFAPAEYWDNKTQKVTIPVFRLMNDKQRELTSSLEKINAKLQELRSVIADAFNETGGELPQDWLKTTIERHNFPERFIERPKVHYLTDAFLEYIDSPKRSIQRKRMAATVLRTLKRYEAYTESPVELEALSPEFLRAFDNYLRNEYKIVEERPDLMGVCKESRQITPRSDNTVVDRMHIVRAVVTLAVKNGYTNNDPFQRYSIGSPVYGNPIYITIEERNRLYNANLSSHPALAVQRDIFVFQCLIGCRVADLLKLTRENLIDGAIEYVPRKTKDERGDTVRVPLNSIALEIVKRYEDEGRDKLLPFISPQKYNDAIKEAFTLAGLTRPVTVLDPQTRQEVRKPLNEIASSHLARRTFVGNLYKQVKDPNLIGKLSGHVEGSRAFARYRDIDEEMKRDLVRMLE